MRTNSKQRFAFNEDKTRIRANQGHSLDIALQLPAVVPPALLFHGTAEQNLPAIRKDGLSKMNRHHVHLTTNIQIARQVGSRYGKPIILTVDNGSMHRDGLTFYVSENGVWLTDVVPPEYIDFETKY